MDLRGIQESYPAQKAVLAQDVVALGPPQLDLEWHGFGLVGPSPAPSYFALNLTEQTTVVLQGSGESSIPSAQSRMSPAAKTQNMWLVSHTLQKISF